MRSSSRTLPDEADIVGKVIDGDDRAFSKLYDTYVDGIFRFILVRSRDRDTALDLPTVTVDPDLDREESDGILPEN